MDEIPPRGPVVVLVGPPGCGKSTVGWLLARQLGVDFRDTDSDIEAAAGRPIADIFVVDGEPAFRALEKDAVRDALAEHRGVLSLGGGSVVDVDTRALLAGRPVVYLEVGLSDAMRRVGMNRDRPLLLGNIRGQWLRLMEARRPWYEEVARWRVGTDGRQPDEIVAELLSFVAPPSTPPLGSDVRSVGEQP